MSIQTCIAISTFLTGIIAAGYWFRSTKIVPDLSAAFHTGDEGLARMYEINAILQTLQKGSYLNKIAATWTAISTFLAAINSLLAWL